VLEHHAHAAELVAEHFLSRGFEHFIFYSEESNWAYEERGTGFVKALKRSGRSGNWIRWHQSPEYRDGRGLDQWRRQRHWLTNQLRQSPKPVGVFAANDEHALDVLESCESAGIPVPEAVAIVGADNYLLAPGAMQTPISSVDTNLEVLGYRGAALLDELMKGRKPPEAPIRVPASGVVTRKSSDLLAVNHKGVANSLRFILEHFHEPINLADLVAAAAMSRRGLHKAFMEHLGRTPGQELQRLRIERARRLLSGTDHKMEDLAIMCGYQSANSLYVAFRQATGVSPAEFRKLAAAGDKRRFHEIAKLQS
jgi:LacI family transcriptional regulator